MLHLQNLVEVSWDGNKSWTEAVRVLGVIKLASLEKEVEMF